MHSLDYYTEHPDQVLIDAAADPVFRSVMDPTDVQLVTLDRGDGTQVQVEALSRGSIRKVFERVLRRCREKGVELKRWICSSEDFNLCAKLNTPVGALMRQLHEFLERKWAERGVALAHIFTIGAALPVEAFLGIVTALFLVNKELVELCDCPKPPKVSGGAGAT